MASTGDGTGGDVPMTPEGDKGGLESGDIWGESAAESGIDPEILELSDEQIKMRTRMLEGNIRVLKSEKSRAMHEIKREEAQIKDNKDKIKLNKTLPYLVGNVVEVCGVMAGCSLAFLLKPLFDLPISSPLRFWMSLRRRMRMLIKQSWRHLGGTKLR
jgi:ATP-dependent 26S proteasome regulatory subunit